MVDSTVCVDDLDADARNAILYQNKDVILAWLGHYADCTFSGFVLKLSLKENCCSTYSTVVHGRCR